MTSMQGVSRCSRFSVGHVIRTTSIQHPKQHPGPHPAVLFATLLSVQLEGAKVVKELSRASVVLIPRVSDGFADGYTGQDSRVYSGLEKMGPLPPASCSGAHAGAILTAWTLYKSLASDSYASYQTSRSYGAKEVAYCGAGEFVGIDLGLIPHPAV